MHGMRSRVAKPMGAVWCSGCVCVFLYTQTPVFTCGLPTHKHRLMSRHRKPEVHFLYLCFSPSLSLSVPLSFIISLRFSSSLCLGQHAPKHLLVQNCAHVFTIVTTHSVTHNMVVVVDFVFLFFWCHVDSCVGRAPGRRGEVMLIIIVL